MARGGRFAGARQPLRGVNLGNWLVLERWMESKKHPGPFAGTRADDERGLRRTLAPDDLQARLSTHRDAQVGPDTFRWLAEAGCNLVRMPVPFHVFGDEHHESCISYVDQAFDWASDAGIALLVDLHTVPGGQNGFDNGGVSGLCTWHLESGQIAATLRVLVHLARRYADHPALFGVEPMNEPASPRIFAGSMKRYGADYPDRVARSAVIPAPVLRQFYRLCYERIRPITGPRVALVLHDRFQLGSWSRFMPADRYPNVWIDTHQYVGTMARGLHVGSLAGHLALARIVGANIARAERHHPVLVGEWSLSHNLRALPKMDPARQQQVMARYAAAQLAAFERGHGSCFWSLANGRYDTWSFKAALENGWLDFKA